tara:strand:- start:19 stop:351 length:333 start_codon:yes stop_codon:yes gene_type:complete
MPKKKTPTFNVAVLADDGLLVGYETVEVVGDRIEVPEKDLGTGRYRWDGETFHPVEPVDPGLPPPSALRAIYKAFQAIGDQGIVLPDETLAWMKAFSTSTDSRADWDKGR